MSGPISPARCVCMSMKPGSSVTSPRSIVRAPAGTVAGSTAVMRPASISTRAFRTVRPLTTSSMRAARTSTGPSGCACCARALQGNEKSSRATTVAARAWRFCNIRVVLGFGSDGRAITWHATDPRSTPRSFERLDRTCGFARDPAIWPGSPGVLVSRDGSFLGLVSEAGFWGTDSRSTDCGGRIAENGSRSSGRGAVRDPSRWSGLRRFSPDYGSRIAEAAASVGSNMAREPPAACGTTDRPDEQPPQ